MFMKKFENFPDIFDNKGKFRQIRLFNKKKGLNPCKRWFNKFTINFGKPNPGGKKMKFIGTLFFFPSLLKLI